MDELGEKRKLPYYEDIFSEHNYFFQESENEFDSDIQMRPALIPMNQITIAETKYDPGVEIKPTEYFNVFNENIMKEESTNVRELVILCTRVVPLKCDACDKIFTTLSILNSHKRNHILPFQRGMEPSTKFVPDDNKFKPKMRQPLQSDKSFNQKPHINQNKLIQHESKSLLDEHKKNPDVHKSIIYQCDTCSYTTSMKNHMTCHLQTHPSHKCFKCDVCGLYFKRESNLFRHTLKHKGFFTCWICRKAFPNQSLLDEHKSTPDVHQIFRCSMCSYTALKKYHLTRHLKSHASNKPFECDECGISFQRTDHLNRHKRSHSLPCRICNKQFLNKTLLDEHEKNPEAHKTLWKFQCNICSYSTFSKGEMTDHLGKHSSNKPFKCDLCGKSFNIKSNMYRHKRTHCYMHKKDFSNKSPHDKHKTIPNAHEAVGKFKCNICSYVTFEKESLASHVKVHSSNEMEELGEKRKLPFDEEDVFSGHHDKQSAVEIEFDSDVYMKPALIPINQTTVVEMEYDSDVDIKPFSDENNTREESAKDRQLVVLCTRVEPLKCHGCDKIFATLPALKRHKQSHSFPFICEMEPSAKFKPGEDKTKPSMIKPLQCNICSFKTFVKNTMNRHLLTHSSSKPFKCDVCGKSFREKSLLKRHKLLHKGFFICWICKKAFPNKSLFDEHKTSPDAHKTLTKYQCGLCPYTTFTKSDVNRHRTTHSPNKPFKCNICGSYFNKKSNLNRHNLKHKGFFTCWMCKKTFPNKSLLDEHKSTPGVHQIFRCNMCSYTALKKFCLTRHLKSHSSNKPFPTKSLLDDHKTMTDVHETFAKFECDHCSYITFHKYNIINHLKSHSSSNYCHLRKDNLSNKNELARGKVTPNNSNDSFLSANFSPATESKELLVNPKVSLDQNEISQRQFNVEDKNDLFEESVVKIEYDSDIDLYS